MLLHKPWRRRVDRKRLRNAAFEPLPAQVSSETGSLEPQDMGDRSKKVDVKIEPVEDIDASGPSGHAH